MTRTSIVNARTKLRQHFPLSITKCVQEATLYGKCISVNEPSLKQGDCKKEFEDLKRCFDKNMKSLKKGS